VFEGGSFFMIWFIRQNQIECLPRIFVFSIGNIVNDLEIFIFNSAREMEPSLF
jgi:hypothetical protein